MDRVKLISQCRYYSGEAKCPFKTTDLQHYWDMEKFYVNSRGILDEQVDGYYKNIKGKEYAGIPRALLITMFNYWGKGVYDIKTSIGSFYALIDSYLQTASDHFPIEEIPHNIKR